MIVKSLHKTLLGAGLLAGLGLTAVAQTAVPAATAPQAQAQAQRGDPASMEQRHAKHREMRQLRAERRMAALKLKLQISAAQEGDWAAWTTAMKPAERQRHDRAEFARLTTPERIDRMRALHAARGAEMDKRGNATKTLYSALNADQKKVFDGESLRLGKRDNRGKGGQHGHHHRG
ncbi:MAG: hypothetical protein JWP65_181 [Ramlibacter sp.]|jgi:protein CpxP|uniref:Spy/CpxP family protein refolding chaperone n=1 Tax=Ramlibacter sp. TaxID=1917967 RepID=UPI00260F7CB7|nr:Spy/CpxP family protein refolding chaperone [Ramlibacter sp.]MDB5749760.1 hypothetical protein [Ramlibacter sp.]